MNNAKEGNKISADPLMAVANASVICILRSWDWPDDDVPADVFVSADRLIAFNLQELNFYDRKRLHAAYSVVMDKLQAEGKSTSDCCWQLSQVIKGLEPLVEREFADLESRPQSEWPTLWKSEDDLKQSDNNLFTEAMNCLSSGHLSSIQTSARRLLREGSIPFASF